MIFSTYKFIFGFLPIVFGGYYIINRLKLDVISKIFLVVASLYFYAQGSLDFFPYFLCSIFGNYIVGSALSKLQGDETKRQKKILFLIGILANVALLGYYKYTDFFIENINWLADTNIGLKNIALPIGISFFTFQLIAFLVDSYRGETKEYDILNYLLFITFFPQLIVGPIVHHSEVVPQFENDENRKVNWNNVAAGIFLFSIGCAKKILLADPLTDNAQGFFDIVVANGTCEFLQSWFYSIEYTISYYFDLSGYADMAIGLGLLFNIHIPKNFNSPYKARNFQDYWRRWHVTLSRFLGDYIFRNVFRKGDKWRNFYVATMITFFVSGFWHGAGWTFVVWGLVNGIFVCTASWMGRKGWKFPAVIAYPLTAMGVVMSRVLFVSDTFSKAWAVYKGMFNFKYLLSTPIMQQMKSVMRGNMGEMVILFVGICICWFATNSNTMLEKFKPNFKNAIFVAVLLALSLMSMNKVSAFLYFQF